MTSEEIEERLHKLGVKFSHTTGQGYSAWTFKGGEHGLSIMTGDGGAMLMIEAFEKAYREAFARVMSDNLYGRDE